MPRTRSLAWSELKIGILAVIAIALASAIILAVGGQTGFAWQRYELKTRFPDVRGLKEGAVVRAAGVEIGKVDRVAFAGADVEVTMSVRDDMRQRITTNSRAAIGSLSLLGESVIDITTSTGGRPLNPGEYIQGKPASGQISDVADSATQSLEQATALLRDIRAGKGTVGKLFTDDKLYRDINSFVDSAQVVAGYLSRGEGTLGRLAKDPAAYEQLRGALTNLQQMTARINAGEGSIGKLLKDEKLATSLSSATGHIDQIAGRVDRGEGTVGKLVTERELYDRLNGMAGRLEQLTTSLQQGQGTAGQLLHDQQLYDNMNQAANELRGLIADIRRDPKKYLNVRVSIF
jgi:phospholipid/cholesterol/gamma-HCH transport system substrate-binding protein